MRTGSFTAAATAAQLVALAVVLGGLYLLAGLAWTLIIGGALMLVTSVVVELLVTRARAVGRADARERGR